MSSLVVALFFIPPPFLLRINRRITSRRRRCSAKERGEKKRRVKEKNFIPFWGRVVPSLSRGESFCCSLLVETINARQKREGGREREREREREYLPRESFSTFQEGAFLLAVPLRGGNFFSPFSLSLSLSADQLCSSLRFTSFVGPGDTLTLFVSRFSD